MASKQQKQAQQNKGKKQQNKNKSNTTTDNEDVKRDQKLQAILLADSFTNSFRPITLETPKVLLPLVNVPMLEYTIEFLAKNGVEEIFIFCVNNADAVESYVNSSKWISKISVKCITSAACLSGGDALREMDALNIVRSDPFILISGDVVANLDLKQAIAYHRQKCKEDINNVMTMVMKSVQKSAGIKPIMDDLVVALDNKTSQIVLFENSYSVKDVQLPLEVINDRSGLSFHTDLLDCHVDICSPELLVQFSDNFDYQHIRKDFVHNEVSNWALGKHMYAYLIEVMKNKI